MDSNIIKRMIKGFYGRLVLDKNAALSTVLFVTSRCNAKCKHCFNWKKGDNSKKRKELTLEEIKKISKNKNLKYLYVLTISGGEPFLRNDLDKIIELFYKNTNIAQVNIPTNGTMPDKIVKITKNILEKCPHIHLRVGLSIDGLDKDHDNMRGYPGCFKKLLITYNKLRTLERTYPNFIISASVTMSTFNQKKVKDVLNYFEQKLKLEEYILIHTYGQTRVKNAVNVNPKDYIEASKTYEKLLKEKCKDTSLFSRLFLNLSNLTQKVIKNRLINKKREIKCYSGRRMLVIDDIGDVYPCEVLDRKIGSLRDINYNFNHIFESKIYKETIDYINRKKCVCPWICSIKNSIISNPLQIINFKSNKSSQC